MTPTVPAPGTLDPRALVDGGSMLRVATRNDARPVSAFRRAGDAVLGGIIVLAAVGAYVSLRSGII